MSTHTEVITVTCPNPAKPVHGGGNGDPEWDGEALCEGENDVEISFEWEPAEKQTRDYPGSPGGLESVTCPPITCEWCGYVFSEADRARIEQDFQPTEQDDEC